MYRYLWDISSYQRRKELNLNENLAVTLGGGFFGGILIGCALKKIIKIVAIIAGFFLADLAYLQYQQIANINWDRLQAISEDTLTTLANATQQIPGFDGSDNVPAEFVMTNLGIPLTGLLAIGFTIGIYERMISSWRKNIMFNKLRKILTLDEIKIPEYQQVFNNVIGYEDIKLLLYKMITSKYTNSVLLTGPPLIDEIYHSIGQYPRYFEVADIDLI